MEALKINDAPQWVDPTRRELIDIADWFEKTSKRDNAQFLRKAAMQLEVLAGAYQTTRDKCERLRAAILDVKEQTENCNPGEEDLGELFSNCEQG